MFQREKRWGAWATCGFGTRGTFCMWFTSVGGLSSPSGQLSAFWWWWCTGASARMYCSRSLSSQSLICKINHIRWNAVFSSWYIIGVGCGVYDFLFCESLQWLQLCSWLIRGCLQYLYCSHIVEGVGWCWSEPDSGEIFGLLIYIDLIWRYFWLIYNFFGIFISRCCINKVYISRGTSRHRKSKNFWYNILGLLVINNFKVASSIGRVPFFVI